eukprot:4680491-Amphidinium_carterae.1
MTLITVCHVHGYVLFCFSSGECPQKYNIVACSDLPRFEAEHPQAVRRALARRMMADFDAP